MPVPDLVHGATVFAYALLALACWCIGGVASDARLWRRAGWVLAALALDKQFDLLNAATQFGRDLAMNTGWYENRRPLQRWFVLGLAAAAALLFALLLRRTPSLSAPRTALAAGVVFLVSFAVVRVVSAHRIDVILTRSAALGLRWNSVLELAGIALIAVAAAAEAIAGGRARQPGADRLGP